LVQARLWNFLFATIMLCSLAAGQEQATDANRLNHDPEAAVISASDVRLFWNAYDLWQKREHGEPGKLAGILQSEYLDKGSQGVKDFTPGRITSADYLAKAVIARRGDYEAVRRNTEQMESFIPEIRKSFRNFQKLYPAASFPAVYFVIGAQSSGGTSTASALVIGAEMFGEGPQFLVHLSEVLPMVTHELNHFQQKDHSKNDLLNVAMREGAADFMAELVAGSHINERNKAFADAHEQQIWLEFNKEIHGENRLGEWVNVYQPKNGWPPFMGYYVGYKVCQAYYQVSTDKQKALKTIVEMASPEDILTKSSYEKRFQ
jgi:hypothetical protein